MQSKASIRNKCRQILAFFFLNACDSPASCIQSAVWWVCPHWGNSVPLRWWSLWVPSPFAVWWHRTAWREARPHTPLFWKGTQGLERKVGEKENKTGKKWGEEQRSVFISTALTRAWHIIHNKMELSLPLNCKDGDMFDPTGNHYSSTISIKLINIGRLKWQLQQRHAQQISFKSNANNFKKHRHLLLWRLER